MAMAMAADTAAVVMRMPRFIPTDTAHPIGAIAGPTMDIGSDTAATEWGTAADIGATESGMGDIEPDTGGTAGTAAGIAGSDMGGSDAASSDR
jgi:hypothetical protein